MISTTAPPAARTTSTPSTGSRSRPRPGGCSCVAVECHDLPRGHGHEQGRRALRRRARPSRRPDPPRAAQARPRAHGPAGGDDDRRAAARAHRAGRLRRPRCRDPPRRWSFEVELALDPVHDLVGDRALVAQRTTIARAARRAPRARSSGRRTSGPRSRRPRSCPRARPGGACGTRTVPRMRSIVSSRVHSSASSSSIRASAALRRDQPRLELLVLLLRAVVDARRASGSAAAASAPAARASRRSPRR